MGLEIKSVLAVVQRLMVEELHLVGQEVEDSLHPGQARRLADVTATLDELGRLVAQRRPTRPLVVDRTDGVEVGP